MIRRIEFLLEDKKLSAQMSSLFHGALMELVPQDLADELHDGRVHPYSQYLERRENRWYWVVTACNKELSDRLIRDCLENQTKIELKKAEMTIGLMDRTVTEIPMETLTRKFYEGDAGRWQEIAFLTPTSFKQQGRYLFYPDIRGIYISLLNKYGAAQPSQNTRDEDLLEELVSSTEITRYNLRSVNFHIDTGRVPAFTGQITLKLHGTQTMRNFADFLFSFGVYSGIGIKGALGMGGNRLLTENGRFRREDTGDE